MPASDPPSVHRSGLSILSFQLDAYCNALRMTISTGQTPGPGSIVVLRVLKTTLENVVSGAGIEKLPEVDAGSPPSDVLTIAEILRATLLAFLSPEELDDQRMAMGFHVRRSE